jgi:hypothetical protein
MEKIYQGELEDKTEWVQQEVRRITSYDTVRNSILGIIEKK